MNQPYYSFDWCFLLSDPCRCVLYHLFTWFYIMHIYVSVSQAKKSTAPDSGNPQDCISHHHPPPVTPTVITHSQSLQGIQIWSVSPTKSLERECHPTPTENAIFLHPRKKKYQGKLDRGTAVWSYGCRNPDKITALGVKLGSVWGLWVPLPQKKKDGEELQPWSLTFVKRTHTKMPCKLWVVVMNVGDDKMLPVISTETQWVVPDSREFPCNFHPLCFRWQEDKLQHIPDGSAYLWDDSRQGAARQSTTYCHTHLRTS